MKTTKTRKEKGFLIKEIKGEKDFYVVFVKPESKMPKRFLSLNHFWLRHKLIKDEREGGIGEQIVSTLITAPFPKSEKVKVEVALGEMVRRFLRWLEEEASFKLEKKKRKTLMEHTEEVFTELFASALKNTSAWRKYPIIFRVCFEADIKGHTKMCIDAGPIREGNSVKEVKRLFGIRRIREIDEAILSLVWDAKEKIDAFRRGEGKVLRA
jgi:hypothetical protein